MIGFNIRQMGFDSAGKKGFKTVATDKRFSALIALAAGFALLAGMTTLPSVVFAQEDGLEINGGMEPDTAAPTAASTTTAIPAVEETSGDITDGLETPPNLLENADSAPADDSTAPAVITTGKPSNGATVPVEASADTPVPAEPLATASTPTPMPAKEITSPPAVPVSDDPDLFFDAESLVPSGEMGAKSSGPKKVNPQLQPASRMIIVNKNASANSADAKLVAADRAMKLGRYEAALQMYEDLYAKNNRDPRILMGRAVTLQHLGQYDSAMQTYQQLLDIKPDNVEAKINMLGLLSTKYPAVALRQLLDLSKENPDNVGIVAQVAVTEAQLGNLDEALKYLGMASSMEPNNAGHLFNMAVIADRAGKMNDAVSYYEKALETDAVYGRSQSVPREAIYERLAKIR